MKVNMAPTVVWTMLLAFWLEEPHQHRQERRGGRKLEGSVDD